MKIEEGGDDMKHCGIHLCQLRTVSAFYTVGS